MSDTQTTNWYHKISWKTTSLKSPIISFLQRYIFLFFVYKAESILPALIFTSIISSPSGECKYSLTINAYTFLSVFILTLVFSFMSQLLGRYFPQFNDDLVPRSTNTVDRASDELQEAFAAEVHYTESETLVSNRLRAIAAIDDRINALRSRSTWMLLSIGVLL